MFLTRIFCSIRQTSTTSLNHDAKEFVPKQQSYVVSAGESNLIHWNQDYEEPSQFSAVGSRETTNDETHGELEVKMMRGVEEKMHRLFLEKQRALEEKQRVLDNRERELNQRERVSSNHINNGRSSPTMKSVNTFKGNGKAKGGGIENF